MRKFTYTCDVCSTEMKKEDAEKTGAHPIFPDYSFAAAKGVHICQECREELNAAAQAVIDSKQ